MKQQMFKWVSAAVLILTFTIVLGLQQLEGDFPVAERKFITYGKITAKNIQVANLQVKRPMGVTMNGKFLAVADAGGQRVIVYNIQNKTEQIIKKAGSFGLLSYPVDTAFTPDGKILVADIEKGRVFGFDSNGKVAQVFPASADVKKVGGFIPTAIAVDVKERLYVTDVARHRVIVFDKDGKFLFEFGQEGIEKGQLLYPNGIAVSDGGQVYVADTNNSRIQAFEVFDQKGKFLKVLPMPEGLDLSGPRGLALLSQDKLVFASTLASQLYVYDLSNREVDVVHLTTGLSFPNDVTVAGNEVYVADRGNNRVISFSINPGEVKRIEN